MGFDDTVEEMTTNESELAIDSRCSSTSKVPRPRFIVGKGGIGMLKEGDGH